MSPKLFLHPIKSLRGLVLYYRIFGSVGVAYALYCAFTKRRKLIPVAAKWAKHPLFVRLNTTDVPVFRQVFVEREYGIVESIETTAGTVIDGGANIGLTSVFLANLYPQAKIYAVEPEAANLELLRLNTINYPSIKIVHGAIWNHDGSLGILSLEAQSWGFRVSEVRDETHTEEIPGFRISTLMERFGLERLWLLKLDIEGAEYEVLSDCAAWATKVDNIVAELHEKIHPDVEARFSAATTEFEVVARSRELVLACRPVK